MANPALIDELEKQFRDNPRRVFARLANEYRKAGDFMRAIEICHTHVPQQPGYISGHVVLGQALYDAGELDQARQTFHTALALDPENLIALRQLGDIARDRQEFSDARGWYTRLLEIDPQNDEVVAQLGELSLVEGNGVSVEGRGTGAESNGTGDEGRGAGGEGRGNGDELNGRAAAASADAGDRAVRAAQEEDDTGDESAPTVADETPESELHAPAPWWTTPQPSEEEEDEFAAPGHASLLDEATTFEGEEAIASDGPDLEPLDLTPALEPDDDVAWISAEQVEVDASFTITDAGEAKVEQGDPGAIDVEALDFTFEPEAGDAPLDAHGVSGDDSLSIIVEEDPLAGVQPVRNADPSPFGVAFERPMSAEEHSTFEPLPMAEIDAASADGHDDALRDLPEAPASPWMDTVAPDESDRAVDASDALETSDAETLVEEPSTHWSESTSVEPSREVPDEEPAGQSAPWWEIGVEPERPAAAAPEEPATASSADDVGDVEPESTFVTETMAELYLQQGFRQEALDVYRRLAEQSPHDAALRERIERLERGEGSASEGASAAGAPPRSAASFFKSLASVRPTPPSNAGGPAPEPVHRNAGPAPDAGPLDAADDEAAQALSEAFGPESQPPRPPSAIRAADRDMSLQDIFGGQPPKGGEPSGSMDAFFTPEGERAADDKTGNGDDDDDIEAFNAWLEGLKK